MRPVFSGTRDGHGMGTEEWRGGGERHGETDMRRGVEGCGGERHGETDVRRGVEWSGGERHGETDVRRGVE